MTPINDLSPALPDVRPAPQAGCFVSRLKLSKDSAQSDLRHRAFRTVAIAPSSGLLEIPAQAKAGAEIKSKGVRRLALRVGRIPHARAGLRTRPICATLPQEISGYPVFSARLKNPVDALNNELLDLGILVQGDLLQLLMGLLREIGSHPMLVLSGSAYLRLRRDS
jgi:hypothetical protein